MALKQSNPTKPRRDRQGHETWAQAPYNFVPLAEVMVQARTPIDHDAYHDGEAYTGWIECTLETCSPTYVRGMYTVEQFARLGNKKTDELSDARRPQLRVRRYLAEDDTGWRRIAYSRLIGVGV
jgi:hypothetical protein